MWRDKFFSSSSQATASEEFPLPPAPFRGESRRVDADLCFDWLRQGWLIFMANPGVWIGASLLLLLCVVFISVPVYGQVAVHVLLPLFAAGMGEICRRSSLDKKSEIVDLFIGFRRRSGALVQVGIFFAAGIFAIALIVLLCLKSGFIAEGVTVGLGSFKMAVGSVLLSGLMVAVLSVPVLMATWFAPFLVFFHDMPPLAALRASFMAGVHNFVPALVLGTFFVILAFLALLPLGLGLLLLLPVFSATVYASYRDIFVEV